MFVIVPVSLMTSTCLCVREQRMYSMNRRPRGRAVVISNHFFIKANMEVRDGAVFDEENVCSLLKKLDFDVQLYRNKDASVCLYFSFCVRFSCQTNI